MPELPTPWANGQSEPSQGGSSISSFDPAATTLGSFGSIATVGSFCLFWGKGDGGLACVTRDSVAACPAAGAARASARPIAPTIHPRFSIGSTSWSPLGVPRSERYPRARGPNCAACTKHGRAVGRIGPAPASSPERRWRRSRSPPRPPPCQSAPAVPPTPSTLRGAESCSAGPELGEGRGAICEGAGPVPPCRRAGGRPRSRASSIGAPLDLPWRSIRPSARIVSSPCQLAASIRRSCARRARPSRRPTCECRRGRG